LIVGVGADIIAFTKTGARDATGTRLPVFRQISAPAVADINSGCMLLWDSNAGTMQGDTLEVQCTSGTQFKWRFNSGVFSAPQTITTGANALGGTNISLYFLTTTGFTAVTDAWTWIRDDALFVTSLGGATQVIELNYQWPNVFVGKYLYFLDWSGQLMKYDAVQRTIASAGYRPIFGTDVVFYENHLFVANYADYVPSSSFGVVGCSDLNDVDNFIPLDINEADTYSTLIGLPNMGEAREYIRSTKVHGMCVLRGVLFVFADNGVWATTYAGLGAQSPFNFRPQFGLAFPLYNTMWRKPVQTDHGAYSWTSRGIVLFNGTTTELISEDINDLLLNGTFVPRISYLRYGFHDPIHEEVAFYWHNNEVFGTYGFLVYQERTKSWYFRAGQFDSQAVGSACVADGVWHVAGAGRILKETNTFGAGGATLAFDYNAASFQTPYLESQDLDFGKAAAVKEVDYHYLEAEYTTTADSGSHSTTGVSISVAPRKKYADTVTYTAVSWILSLVDGFIGGLRCSGRIFRYKVMPTMTSGKYPHGFKFHRLELQVNGLPNVQK
jgi:hypothetical protein